MIVSMSTVHVAALARHGPEVMIYTTVLDGGRGAVPHGTTAPPERQMLRPAV
jgi:hypothetical protein